MKEHEMTASPWKDEGTLYDCKECDRRLIVYFNRLPTLEIIENGDRTVKHVMEGNDYGFSLEISSSWA